VSGDDGKDARERTLRVQAMFGRIVPRYDRLNRLMSLGMDAGWRRQAAAAAAPSGQRVLDIGAGTGDLGSALVDQGATAVVGADLTPSMLRAAARRCPSSVRQWCVADALRLPFADESFEVVANAFLLRNLADLTAGLGEMARVLRPGGRLVCLDMTPAPRTPFGSAFRVYFNHVMPRVAGLLSGDRAAYGYLPASLEGFPDAETLAGMLRAAGLADVSYRKLAGGTVALHRGQKPG
jgi:demethylmenaquinone methyltransferase/2-methoxy-6-polyprenyl-1,4-benzoquinol methylase